MDEDNNQENRTTDLQESMQKGKSLLNSAKDKGKKISGSKIDNCLIVFIELFVYLKKISFVFVI